MQCCTAALLLQQSFGALDLLVVMPWPLDSQALRVLWLPAPYFMELLTCGVQEGYQELFASVSAASTMLEALLAPFRPSVQPADAQGSQRIAVPEPPAKVVLGPSDEVTSGLVAEVAHLMATGDLELQPVEVQVGWSEKECRSCIQPRHDGGGVRCLAGLHSLAQTCADCSCAGAEGGVSEAS